jgi:hypothetical protein
MRIAQRYSFGAVISKALISIVFNSFARGFLSENQTRIKYLLK